MANGLARGHQSTNRQVPGTNHRDLLGATVVGLIVVVFCLVLLWHDPHFFWNDDYEISILPVLADVARSWSEGEWPLLSPYSWVCGNLAGEFQYGTFSIFVNAAVIVIWKLPLSFAQQAAALSITHLFVLGMGGYLLARGRQLSPPLSMVVGLVSALNGWIICWGATDWFGALGAFAWLPWAWWGLERALDSQRSRWRFLWPAPFVYLLVTGGFPYTVLMLIVLALWLSLKALSQTRRLSAIWPLTLGLLLGFGLSSPAWLAICDYVRGSAREVQDNSMHFQWLVPFGALPGFILPSWTVNWADFYNRSLPHTATELASGFVPPIAFLCALASRWRVLIRQIKWELGLLGVVLILSMAPSISVFRWSFRWLPFLHIILALCGSEALRLLNSQRNGESTNSLTSSSASTAIRPGLVSLGCVALVTGASFLFNLSGTNAFPFIWITLGIAVAWAILERTNLRSWLPPALTVASLLATYLCIPANCGVPRYNLAPELRNPTPLDPERLYLSIYPAPEFAYRLENKPEPFGPTLRIGSTSMWGGVHFLNGYSPIRPSGVAREFYCGVHGEVNPEMAEWLLEHEAGAEGKLARLGVDGITVANELNWTPHPETEWEVAVTTKEGRVFHRRGGVLARVRSITEIDSRPGERFARADVSQIITERNRLRANVTVPPNGPPALLTVSRPYFNGYSAKLGTVPLKVGTYRGLIPTIELPPGLNGELTLVYRPWWLLLGGTIAGISLCVIIISVAAALATRKADA
jgi:hypothetical protein